MKKNIIEFVKLDKFLFATLATVLVLHYSHFASRSIDSTLLTFFASIGTLPVLVSTY